MKQTVYVDVLLSVNLLADYFLLYAAAVISGRRRDRVRLCIGAAVGAAGSLVMLLPRLPPAVSLLITAFLSAAMTAVSFGWNGCRSFFHTLTVLYVLTAGYSGVMLLLWSITGTKQITVNNGSVYINIDPRLIVLSTVVLYAALSLFSGRIRARGLSRKRCTVTITECDSRVSLEGIIDTGNTLTEPFSGLPVLVTSRKAVAAVLPDGVEEMQENPTLHTERRIRLIPYHTASGSGLMTAYRPCRIDIELDGKCSRNVRAYLALAEENRNIECGIIVNPDALS